MVDAVIEVIDARIPISSRNPIIDELVKSKPRIIVLNKSDLADDKAVKDWAETFRRQGNKALAMNCMSGAGSKELFRLLSSMEAEKNKDKVRQKPYRLMIVGVPNVGNSSHKPHDGKEKRSDRRQAGGHERQAVASSAKRDAASRYTGDIMAEIRGP